MADKPHDEWQKSPEYRLLQAEVQALHERLDDESQFGRVVRDLWQTKGFLENDSGDEHLTFYRHALSQMLLGHYERIVPTDSITNVDSFGAALAKLNIALDQRFTEARALAELPREISNTLFIEDVLNHVFETFHAVIPYDRIGFAFLEQDDWNVTIVRERWSRSDSNDMRITKGYGQKLSQTSLGAVLNDGHPRIINDLKSYLRKHPNSQSTYLMVEEGLRSNLTCPLLMNGKPVGFLFFSCREINAYSSAHIDAFAEVSGQLTKTLEKCRLYEQLNTRNHFLRSVFGRYVSDEIVTALLEDPNALKMGGRNARVTVLMCDLRGFTKMSEKMEPKDVVAVLNNCFNKMVQVIQAHDGTIDNIIGDAIMVLFGAPIMREDDVKRAVSCAFDMQEAMADVNRLNQHMNLPKLAMGIGINTGDVVVGNIGSDTYAKYSAIGASVNLAARLEAKAGPGEVLIAQPTFSDVQNVVRVLDQRKIEAKGFSEPVRAYAISRL